MFKHALAIAAFAAASSITHAAVLDLTPSYTTFGALPEATFSGNGISNNPVAFTTYTNAEGQKLTLGLAATQRYDNPAVAGSNGVYTATAGSNAKGPNNLEGATWNLSYFIKIEGVGGALGDWNLKLYYDLDPYSANPANNPGGDPQFPLGMIDIDLLLSSTNGNSSTLLQGSENLMFVDLFPGLNSGTANTFTTPAGWDFNPNDLGEYSFLLSAENAGHEVHTTIQVNVTEAQNPTNPVPEPGSLALVGLGLAGLAIVRRRKV